MFKLRQTTRSRPDGPLTPALSPREREKGSQRGGFTLIELLVVVGILLVLAGMTVAYINITAGTERARAGSREVQSFLEGARDRAIFDRRARGVRFQLDANDPTNTTAAAMVYIGENDPETGTLDVMDAMTEPDTVQLTLDSGLTLDDLNTRGMLLDGAILKITDGSTTISYPIDLATSLPLLATSKLKLARPYIQTPLAMDLPYELQLAATVLSGQEPTQLPQGIVVDLKDGKLPSGVDFSRFDILFSPRGVVTGPSAAAGIIHLPIADVRDTIRKLPLAAPPRGDSVAYSAGATPDWVVPLTPNGMIYQCTVAGTSGSGEPAWPTVEGQTVTDGGVTWTAFARQGDNYIVTVFTRTGHIVSNPVFQPGQTTTWTSTNFNIDQWVVPSTPNGFSYRCVFAGAAGGSEPTWPTTPGETVLDGAVSWQCYDDQDPFRYAETGESAR